MLQALILDLNDARPAPLAKDDPALLATLDFVASEMGPFYQDNPSGFQVGEHHETMVWT